MMPIVPNRIYSDADLETIFRACEFRPTDFGKKREAHSFTKHIGITNADMMTRASKVRAEIVAITAFPDNASACLAGAMVLNSPVGQAALNELAGYKAVRAEITWQTPRPVPVRYVTTSNQAVKTMLCHWFTMVVDRNVARPHGIHLQTLFGLIDPDAEKQAVITDRNDDKYVLTSVSHPAG
jgi:hypothetical protein